MRTENEHSTAKSGHTPGKLTVKKGAYGFYLQIPYTSSTHKPSSVRLCDMPEDEVDPETKANVERLALCWNLHDELVAFIQDQVDTIESALERQGASLIIDPKALLSSARDVLAKVKP